ncbi:MAG: hypothetical protein M9962_11235 [Oligoflexia bacterium]|nr:hypothetical protein [Oligoflexia bacterium]
MEELYQNVVLSFPQVWRKVFKNRAKATVMNRLARLESSGLITRWKVPRLRAGFAKNEILVVFQITTRGIRGLEKAFPKKDFRKHPVKISGYSLLHDVLLVDVVDVLKEKFMGAKIQNGKLLEQREKGKIVLPDAVIEMANGGERWAIELELTAKTEKRYREIILRYRLERNISRVLYIIEAPRVYHKLAKVLGKNPQKFCHNPTERFLVAYVEDLKKERLNDKA